MSVGPGFRFTVLHAGAALAMALSIASALAQAQDRARENCRDTVGRPFVQRCMQEKHDLDACRAAAEPQVSACVRAAKGSAGPSPAAPLEGMLLPKPVDDRAGADRGLVAGRGGRAGACSYDKCVQVCVDGIGAGDFANARCAERCAVGRGCN